MDLGAPEILLIIVVMFFFFGAKKIPEMMRGLGTGLREFRKAAREIQEDVEKEVKQLETGKSDNEGKRSGEEPRS